MDRIVPGAGGARAGQRGGAEAGRRAAAPRTLPVAVVLAGTVRSSAVPSVLGEVLVVVTVGLAVGWWDWRVGLVAALVAAALLRWQVATTGTSLVRAGLRVRTVDRRTGWPAGWGVLAPGRTVTVGLSVGRDPLRTLAVAVPAVSSSADPWGVGQPPPVMAVLAVGGGEPLELTGPAVVGTRPVALFPGCATVRVTDLSRTVSRNHMVVEPTTDGIWVTDLDSTNGTSAFGPGIPETQVPARVRTFVKFGLVLVLGVRQVLVLHPAQAVTAGRWSA